MEQMAAQLESVLASLGRVESETVKSSQLKTTVADAMSEFTVRLEQTEKNIVALQATMKDLQDLAGESVERQRIRFRQWRF